MSDKITIVEKLKIEKFFRMDTGSVLDFSNRGFQEFVARSTQKDVYDVKYNYNSGSKANRLRAFWDKESNYTVGTLISDMLIYWKEQKNINDIEITPDEQKDYYECLKISERLKQNTPVENLDAIQANNADKDFFLLAKLIREEIERNQPEAALDRLHTFAMKYFRELCRKHNLDFDSETTLNGLFGKYVKHLVQKKLIHSLMTERILKYSIHVLEAFNGVRNNQSFAHDNPILNYHESILIFNNISSSIKFIETIENHIISSKQSGEIDLNNLQF